MERALNLKTCMVKRLKAKNVFITSMVKWTCSYFGLQHKPSTEANEKSTGVYMLFKI